MDAIKKKNIIGDPPTGPAIQNRTQILHNHSTVIVKTPAKINLSLVVLEKRPDGYHDLHTVMVGVDLYDHLQFKHTDTPGIHLSCTGRSLESSSDNLVYRATAKLAKAAMIEPAVAIHLQKEIPIGAGLGGGSSDAAAALRGLNRLWNLNFSRDQLHEIAAQLGSDVPFFLYDCPAVCTGRGEVVQPLQRRCLRTVLLIIPDIHVSTRNIYHRHVCCSQRNKDLMRRVRYFLRKGDLDGLLIQGINNLADTCLECFGELADLKRRIEQMDIGPVNVSGSGSCLFASSSEPDTLQRWADRIQAEQLAEVKIVKFLNPNDAFVEVHHANL